jgi:DNA-binding GntR family transcriptional regulator
MLTQGEIAPGSKLNERELCERLEVSRTPLREAVKQLAAEGLVELLPNRGAVAIELDEDDILHTFEALACLEGMAAELATLRIDDRQLTEIKALHYEMLAAFTRRDLPTYYSFNARIHDAINVCCGNPVLTKTYRDINRRVQSLRFRSNHDEAKWTAAVRDHEAMIDALERRDGPSIRAIMVAHLERKLQTVLAQMRSERNHGTPKRAG